MSGEVSRTDLPREYLRDVPLQGQPNTLGRSFNLQFTGIEDELVGFPLHVLGLIIRCDIAVTVANATGICPAIKLYDALKVFDFTLDDHSFLRQVRGSTIKNDERICNTGPIVPLVADLPSADANLTRSLEYYVPFASPRAVQGGELDGCIPVGALLDKDFRIQVGNSGDIPHVGVTLTGVTNITVEARLAPLSKLRVPTGWTVRERTDTNLIFQEAGEGFWEYCAIAPLTATQDTPDLSAYQNLRVTVGSGVLRNATPGQVTREFNVRQRATDIGADTESTTAPTRLFILPPLASQPGKMISRQPIGQLKLEVSARPSALVSTDLIYRARGTRYPAFYSAFLKRVGAQGKDVKAKVQRSTPKRTFPDWLIPHMDASITWPGMKYTVPASGEYRG